MTEKKAAFGNNFSPEQRAAALKRAAEMRAAREAYKAKMNAEAPNPQSQAAAAVAAAHGTAEQGGDVAQAAKL